jgi:predicted amidophosphoribosyltransferase
LVDDVLTTGATAQSLARLLIDAGASRVDVYCLARTAKPGAPT